MWKFVITTKFGTNKRELKEMMDINNKKRIERKCR